MNDDIVLVCYDGFFSKPKRRWLTWDKLFPYSNRESEGMSREAAWRMWKKFRDTFKRS